MPSDSSLLLDAITFAADRHRNQRRKGPGDIPYINHPLTVANIIASVGGVADIDVLRAAVLHDTVEDVGVTKDELISLFGEKVADLVMEVTDDKTLPKPARKAAQIEHAPHLSKGAKLVKLGDKTANLRDLAENPIPGWSLERRKEYFEWAKRVVDAGCRGVNEGLERAFDEAYSKKP
jgi:guanosine-3',5'-bis(diphosphate) 3'-pyrophosphohydrolase